MSPASDPAAVLGGLEHNAGLNIPHTSTRRKSNAVKTYNTPSRPNWKPGAEPGIDANASNEKIPNLDLHADCDILIVDWSDTAMKPQRLKNDTLAAALNAKRPHQLPCRWISINGLSWDVIKQISRHYGLHRLAVEDLINTRTRTKVDWYSDHAFAVLTLAKLVHLHSHGSHGDACPSYSDSPRVLAIDGSKDAPLIYSDGERMSFWQRPFMSTVKGSSSVSSDTQGASSFPIRTLHRYESGQNPEHTAFMEQNSALTEEGLVVGVEQVAIFLLADNTIISFFEQSGADVEEPILERLGSAATILRRSCDASLMLQAIIDAIVDLAMPVKDAYNKARKDLQIDVLTTPSVNTSKSLHIFSEEIDMLQNLFKPVVNLINSLRDHIGEPIVVPAVGTDASSSSTSSHAPSHALSHTQSHTSSHGPVAGRTAARPAAQRQTTMQASTVVITPLARMYLGDVLDHCLSIIQSLEQMDNSANNLSSLMFNTLGANTNNFMMIIALVTVFFSPLTFLTGYFGMNFEHFDAISQHSDAFFWYVAVPSTVVFILLVAGRIFYRGARRITARFHVKRARRQRRAARESVRMKNA